MSKDKWIIVSVLGSVALLFAVGVGAVHVQDRIEAHEEELERQAEIASAWDDALELGMEAAVAAQDARAQQQWVMVSDKWAAAIAKLELVAEADPNYQVAQDKIVEYQANRDVALQRLEAKAAEDDARRARLDAQAGDASSDVETSVAAIDAYLAAQDPSKELFLGADTLPDSDYELGIVVSPAWALLEDSNKEFLALHNQGMNWG